MAGILVSYGSNKDEYPDGVKWQETPKGGLLVLDAKGDELGRYQPYSWHSVQKIGPAIRDRNNVRRMDRG